MSSDCEAVHLAWTYEAPFLPLGLVFVVESELAATLHGFSEGFSQPGSAQNQCRWHRTSCIQGALHPEDHGTGLSGKAWLWGAKSRTLIQPQQQKKAFLGLPGTAVEVAGGPTLVITYLALPPSMLAWFTTPATYLRAFRWTWMLGIRNR